MKFIVGLGNPGEKYSATRHNAGFMGVDLVAQKLGVSHFEERSKFSALVAKVGETVLIKPQTYMNDSGRAVRAVLDFYQQISNQKDATYDNLYVLHDDLDLELGHVKLQLGTGPKVHNGLLSLYEHLKTNQFWHGRLGVDGRQGDRSLPGHVYVLQPFSPPEKETLDEAIKKLIDQIL